MGHELDRDTAALVPATTIGRMLSQDEGAALIRQFERGFPKRAAATSVRPGGSGNGLKQTQPSHPAPQGVTLALFELTQAAAF
jgi:hypothetical protein